jgi:3-methylcrotonyl-CoA carboxylase alpha subunit/geranyl-CoA carboxylase alpha subunit
MRPLRIAHRGAFFDVPVCEAEGAAAGQAQVATLAPGEWHVQVGAVDLFLRDASFDPPADARAADAANALHASFNGRVVAVQAQAGDEVGQGDTLLVIESMKLEHALAAPRAGRVEMLHVAPGQQVAPGQLLVSLAAP